jgi:hypothetical protein
MTPLLAEPSSHRSNPCPRGLTVGLIFGLLVIGAGCASTEYSYSTIVSGGEQLKFVMTKGHPEDAKGEGLRVVVASIAPKAETQEVFYRFEFIDETGGRTFQSVRVEDVTETAPILLVDDPAPTLTNKHWAGASRALGAQDPALKWVYYVNESVRITRFTVTTADGHKIILHQATLYPGFMKMLVRGMFGEKY